MAIALGGNSINKAYLGTTEIQKMYLGSELVFSKGLEIPTGIKLTEVSTTGLTPIMTNFRVGDATPTHVHFDSPLGPIEGLTIQGFVIFGKTITAVNTLLNYFTLSDPLTHWDNNTIKLTGGNGAVYDFDLQDIENNIVEPTASNIRYGSRLGSGTQDGLSEANAWDWGEVDANASAGMTIHVKAGGDFGAITLSQDGAIDSPIIIKGYKTTPGDLDGVHYAWGGAAYDVSNTISNVDAPTLNGLGSGIGFSVTGDYIIVKNFQSWDWDTNIKFSGTGNIFDNCLSDENNDSCFTSNDAVDSRISNSIGRNWDMYGIYGISSNTYYKDCKLYLDRSGPGADYFTHISGYNAKLIGLELQKLSPATGGQHGLSLKGAAGPTPVPAEEILVEDCTTFNVSFPIEARWHTVKNNVFRDITMSSDSSLSIGNGGHITMMNGANFNVFDNVKLTEGYAGVRFLASAEQPAAPTGGHDNIFKNCLFINCLYGIEMTEDTDGQNREYYDNEFINCTWYNSINKSYAFINNTSDDIRDNTISNCIINGRDSVSTNTLAGFTFDYSNFYDSFAIPSGTGNINDNPTFEDTVDFRPTNDALISAVKIVDYDAFGNERADITTMGYFIDADEVIEEPPSTFEITSYAVSNETATTAEVTATMSENCSINYYVDTVKNAASSDDFNAFEVSPTEWRHTRTLTGLTPGTTANLIIEVTAEDDLEVVQSGNIPLTTLPDVTTIPDYYVALSGDNSDGLTELTAWNSISSLMSNIGSITSGNVVGIKRGDEFTDSIMAFSAKHGSVGNPILFTAYGTGAKPIISNSTITNYSWINDSGNIWYTTSVATEYYRLDIDGSGVQKCNLYEELGVDLSGSGFPTSIGTFWYGDKGQGERFYVYSTDSPENHDIELSESAHVVDLKNCSYIDFDNIEFQGGRSYNISMRGMNTSNITNCTFGAKSRVGINATYSTGNSLNIVVDNCVFDSKITWNYDGAGTYDGATALGGAEEAINFFTVETGQISNCAFTNWPHASLNMVGSGVGHDTSNVKIFNNYLELLDNISYGGGLTTSNNSFGHEIYNNLIYKTKRSQFGGYDNHYHDNVFYETKTSPLKSFNVGQGVDIQNTTGYAHDNTIENNVFIRTSNVAFRLNGNNTGGNSYNHIFRNNIAIDCGADYSDLGIQVHDNASLINNIFDNNDIYNTVTTSTIEYEGVVMTVSTWNAETGISGNISDDPLFIDDTSDWQLQNGSPCINSGVPSTSTEDYYGNARPYLATNVDIGINETNQ